MIEEKPRSHQVQTRGKYKPKNKLRKTLMKDSTVSLTLRPPVLLRLSWRHHNDSPPQLAHHVIVTPKINASKLFLKLDEKTLRKKKKQCMDGKP